jgi:glycine/D-amino acid oxidase-like deaminating enzyme
VLERFAGPASDNASSHGQLRVTRSAYLNACEVMGMSHLAVRRLDLSQAAQQYPQFKFDKDAVILDDRTAGTILASETVKRLIERLTQTNVEVRYGTQVHGFERSREGYLLQTEEGGLETHRLVVAAGPWTPGLVPCAPGRITPIRQTVGYFRVAGLPTGTGIGEFPTWAHLGSGVNPIHYGLPAHAGQGLKVARHQSLPISSPPLLAWTPKRRVDSQTSCASI